MISKRAKKNFLRELHCPSALATILTLLHVLKKGIMISLIMQDVSQKLTRIGFNGIWSRTPFKQISHFRLWITWFIKKKKVKKRVNHSFGEQSILRFIDVYFNFQSLVLFIIKFQSVIYFKMCNYLQLKKPKN